MLPSSLKVLHGKNTNKNFSSKNMFNSEKKDKIEIPQVDNFKNRKPSNKNMVSIHSNKFELTSNKGGVPLSTKSKGPSVNSILARRKESF